MPKMKTNSSAKKRFSKTGSGKIKRNRAGMSHLLRKKSKKTKTHLNGTTIANSADEKRIKKLMNI